MEDQEFHHQKDFDEFSKVSKEFEHDRIRKKPNKKDVRKKKNNLIRHALTMVSVVAVSTGVFAGARGIEEYKWNVVFKLLSSDYNIDTHDYMFRKENVRECINACFEDNKYYYIEATAADWFNHSDMDEEYVEELYDNCACEHEFEEAWIDHGDTFYFEETCNPEDFVYEDYKTWKDKRQSAFEILYNGPERWDEVCIHGHRGYNQYEFYNYNTLPACIFRTYEDEKQNRVYEIYHCMKYPEEEFCKECRDDISGNMMTRENWLPYVLRYCKYIFPKDSGDYMVIWSRYVEPEYAFTSIWSNDNHADKMSGFCLSDICTVDGKTGKYQKLRIVGNLNSDAVYEGYCWVTYDPSLDAEHGVMNQLCMDDPVKNLPYMERGKADGKGNISVTFSEQLQDFDLSEYICRNEWKDFFKLIGEKFPQVEEGYSYWDEFYIEDELDIVNSRYNTIYWNDETGSYYIERGDEKDNQEELEETNEPPEDIGLSNLLNYLGDELETYGEGDECYLKGYPVEYEPSEDGLQWDMEGSWYEADAKYEMTGGSLSTYGEKNNRFENVQLLTSEGTCYINPIYCSKTKTKVYAKYKCIGRWLSVKDMIEIPPNAPIYYDPNLTNGELVLADRTLFDGDKIAPHEEGEYDGVKYYTIPRNGIRYIIEKP